MYLDKLHFSCYTVFDRTSEKRDLLRRALRETGLPVALLLPALKRSCGAPSRSVAPRTPPNDMAKENDRMKLTFPFSAKRTSPYLALMQICTLQRGDKHK